ncbi:diamine N-acetyltransferase [Anaerolineae bacterium]|nr:diamine N-acetyltransferase [Anaerolineae bacterium]
MNNILEGKLVRLVAANSEKDAETTARWSRDSEYARLLDSDPARVNSVSQAKEGIKKWMENDDPHSFGFMIRARADDRLIGFVGLGGISWTHGDAWIGIGIGEREYWGKGYGTDAMRTLLQFAFAELNLHRVSLNVFEYNPRAIRSYEKAGFTIEGRVRGCLNRDGKRYDAFWMGILREEWERAVFSVQNSVFSQQSTEHRTLNTEH